MSVAAHLRRPDPPNEKSCPSLIRALAVETHEHWIEATRCLNIDALKEMRRERLRSAA
jgi:hypothetical protein